jgi:hypothetical protein
MKSAFVFAVLTLLIAQTKAATTTFDGNWWVTVDYHEYKNPDGSTALAAVKHFPVKVNNGVLHGEIGTRGAADWYELNGTIAADGAATIRANGITGSPKHTPFYSHPGIPFEISSGRPLRWAARNWSLGRGSTSPACSPDPYLYLR